MQLIRTRSGIPLRTRRLKGPIGDTNQSAGDEVMAAGAELHQVNMLRPTQNGCAGHQRVRGAQELAIDVYLRCSLTSPFGPSDPRLHWKLAVQTESVSPPELPKIGRSV
jgi:hypothetical protein